MWLSIRTVECHRQAIAIVLADCDRVHCRASVVQKAFDVPQEAIGHDQGMGKHSLQFVEESCLLLHSYFLADILQQFDVIHGDS